MNRSIRTAIGIVGVLAVISVLVITQQSNPQRAEAQVGMQPIVSSGSEGQVTYAHQPGIPGIRTSLGSSAVPAFTDDDVRQYFATHDVMYQADATKPTITRIQFLSTKEANAQLHQQLDREDDAIVCIVTLNGEFVAAGPPSAGVSGGSTDIVVFDAKTGNVIGNILNVDKMIRAPRRP